MDSCPVVLCHDSEYNTTQYNQCVPTSFFKHNLKHIMIRFQHCADIALHSITIPRFMMLSVVVFFRHILEVDVREAWQVKNTFIEVSDSDNDKEQEF